MQRKRLKPIVVSILYGTVCISLIVSLMLVTNKVINDNTSALNYITSSTITDEVKPVVNDVEEVHFVRPYKDSDISILKNYYSKDEDRESQEKSLILYENTYIQNKGIDYGREEVFDVVSISNGTITSIEEDDILGNIVLIEYDNNIIASYQSITDITKSVGDAISIGEKLGVSSTSNICKDIGNHVHIEILKDGININPETIFEEGI